MKNASPPSFSGGTEEKSAHSPDMREYGNSGLYDERRKRSYEGFLRMDFLENGDGAEESARSGKAGVKKMLRFFLWALPDFPESVCSPCRSGPGGRCSGFRTGIEESPDITRQRVP